LANPAVFLDRDGVINELVYYPDMGVIDSPFTVGLFHILPGVGDAVRSLQEAGYKVVVTSNQPGVARGRFTEETLRDMDLKLAQELSRYGAHLDGIYYCPHHPEGTGDRYRVECDCRKPKPGLLLRAAGELDINLAASYMIGDSLTDVKAGERAGCRTVLIGRLKCDTCRLMAEQDSRPDIIAPDLPAAARILLNGSASKDQTDRNGLKKAIRGGLLESARLKELVSELCADTILQSVLIITESLRNGGKVVLLGNGGSASDAQHIAAELVGKFLLERQALPAIALTTNTSVLTALGNDYGYETVFRRQIEALVNTGDVVIGLSTSGNSPNVIAALELAKQKGAKTLALTGASGGRLSGLPDLLIAVPSMSTPRIQEAHITIGHIVSELVERELADGKMG
jgi:D-sedoheptulose 7-phosphate isomerase